MIPGIDVSHYNGVIDWKQVAASGVKFAYIKCTDGPTKDPRWAINSGVAGGEGLKIGSYHFLRPGTADQLTKFIELYKRDPTDDLPPCLDVELIGELPVLECAQRIVDELKRVPVIYTNHSVGSLLPKNAGAYPLWLAEYLEWEDRAEILPDPWNVWTFWQHTDKGSIPGIVGNVDLDWFNGDQEEFDLWLEQVKGLPT
jgi:lysozyme